MPESPPPYWSSESLPLLEQAQQLVRSVDERIAAVEEMLSQILSPGRPPSAAEGMILIPLDLAERILTEVYDEGGPAIEELRDLVLKAKEVKPC